MDENTLLLILGAAAVYFLFLRPQAGGGISIAPPTTSALPTTPSSTAVSPDLYPSVTSTPSNVLSPALQPSPTPVTNAPLPVQPVTPVATIQTQIQAAPVTPTNAPLVTGGGAAPTAVGSSVPINGPGSGLKLTDTIQAGGEKYYNFIIPTQSSQVILYMEGYWNAGNQDVFVSTSGQPTSPGFSATNKVRPSISPLWFNPGGSNNQTVYIPGTFPAGTQFFVTVENSSNITGQYDLYWTAN